MITNAIHQGNAYVKICIDSSDNTSYQGKAYTLMEEKPFIFQDLIQLFLHIDQLFDHHGKPQSFQSKRTFTKHKTINHYCFQPSLQRSFDQIQINKGKLGNFDVVVTSRQNTTWQGILFLENGKKIPFHTFLELIDSIEHSIKKN